MEKLECNPENWRFLFYDKPNREQFLNMRTAFYLFVDDVEEIHQRAVVYGAKVEFEPTDMPYEDRQSGIIDPSGNYWWISKRLDK